MANTLIFADSFSHWTPTSGWRQKWTVNAGSITLGSPSPSGLSYLASGTVGTNFNTLGISAPSASTIGIRFKALSLATFGAYWAIYVSFDGQIQYALYVDSSGNLGVANATQLGSGVPSGVYASGVITAGIWYYAEVSCGSFNSSGSITLKLNGSTVASGTVNTTGGASGTLIEPNPSCVGANGTTAGYVCDFYCDSTASNFYATNANGIYVYPLFTAAPGQTTAWTNTGGSANWNSVSNNPPIPASDYVSSSTSTQVDLYEIQSLPGGVSTVVATQVCTYATETSGSGTIEIGVGNGSSSSYDSAHTVTTTPLYQLRGLNTNPITSSAWTTGDFSTLQIGQKKVS